MSKGKKLERDNLVNQSSHRLQLHQPMVSIAQPIIRFRGEISLESAMRKNPQLHVSPPDHQVGSSRPRSYGDAGGGCSQ